MFEGKVQVYYGDCKGKTTATLGLAMRCVGHGERACIVQFMKNTEMMDAPYGELTAAKRLAPELEIRSFGRKGWAKKGEPHPEDVRLAGEALALAREKQQDEGLRLLALDEILNAHLFGLIGLNEVLDFIKSRPASQELVLSGYDCPQEVIDAADLVTKMSKVKHYYDQGVSARRCIEY